MDRGAPYLVAAVKLPAATSDRTVSAEVEVVVEGGGREAEPPIGAAVPAIIQWRAAVGETVVSGSTMLLPAGEESDWWLYATYVPDAVVRFRVNQATTDAL
jgi:hypothetical protein